MIKSWHVFLKSPCYIAEIGINRWWSGYGDRPIDHKVLYFAHPPCWPPAPGGLLQRQGLEHVRNNSFNCGEAPAKKKSTSGSNTIKASNLSHLTIAVANTHTTPKKAHSSSK